jgi:hypothetical protein
MVSDFNDDNIKKIIVEENLEACIVSYGGCGSNILNLKLQENCINCNTELWRTKLCHYPKRIDIDIPVIYIYRDPIRAFLSVRRRGEGYYLVNQIKLSNGNYDIVFSDENLLYLMIQQFYNWTNERPNNILIIKYEELFCPEIKNKLENFLKRKLCEFPIKFINPTVDDLYVNNLSTSDIKLFNKYKKDIDYINNFTYFIT